MVYDGFVDVVLLGEIGAKVLLIPSIKCDFGIFDDYITSTSTF